MAAAGTCDGVFRSLQFATTPQCRLVWTVKAGSVDHIYRTPISFAGTYIWRCRRLEVKPADRRESREPVFAVDNQRISWPRDTNRSRAKPEAPQCYMPLHPSVFRWSEKLISLVWKVDLKSYDWLLAKVRLIRQTNMLARLWHVPLFVESSKMSEWSFATIPNYICFSMNVWKLTVVLGGIYHWCMIGH